MSKELEALEVLTDWARFGTDRSGQQRYSVTDLNELIKQALTPPTEQEVCKALSKWLNVKEKIRYKDNQFQYKLCNYNGKNCIWTPINITLYGKGKTPPHLITMIGRFYEGKVEE